MGFPLVGEDYDLSCSSCRGEYVEGRAWNELVADPDVILVDTRNEYEIGIGTFPNALDPKTISFRECPAYVERELSTRKDTKIAMFCTGGVRCEKASAYMKRNGFEKIYSLKGGILKYLEEVPVQESMFLGSCFVFDRRTSVETGVRKGKHVFCFTCRSPLSPDELELPSYREGVQCLYCENTVSEKKKEASFNRHKNIDLARKLGDKHLGKNYQKGSTTGVAPGERIHRECSSQIENDIDGDNHNCK